MAARASASRGDRVPPAGHRAGSARPGGPVPDGDAGACWPAAPWSRPRPRPATASAGPACGETVGCRPREVRAKCARASSFHARARSGHILEILSRCGRAVKRIPAAATCGVADAAGPRPPVKTRVGLRAAGRGGEGDDIDANRRRTSPARSSASQREDGSAHPSGPDVVLRKQAAAGGETSALALWPRRGRTIAVYHTTSISRAAHRIGR